MEYNDDGAITDVWGFLGGLGKASLDDSEGSLTLSRSQSTTAHSRSHSTTELSRSEEDDLIGVHEFVSSMSHMERLYIRPAHPSLSESQSCSSSETKWRYSWATSQAPLKDRDGKIDAFRSSSYKSSRLSRSGASLTATPSVTPHTSLPTIPSPSKSSEKEFSTVSRNMVFPDFLTPPPSLNSSRQGSIRSRKSNFEIKVRRISGSLIDSKPKLVKSSSMVKQRNSNNNIGTEMKLRTSASVLPPNMKLSRSVPDMHCDPDGNRVSQDNVQQMITQFISIRPESENITIESDPYPSPQLSRKNLKRMANSDPAIQLYIKARDNFLSVGNSFYLTPNDIRRMDGRLLLSLVLKENQTVSLDDLLSIDSLAKQKEISNDGMNRQFFLKLIRTSDLLSDTKKVQDISGDTEEDILKFFRDCIADKEETNKVLSDAILNLQILFEIPSKKNARLNVIQSKRASKFSLITFVNDVINGNVITCSEIKSINRKQLVKICPILFKILWGKKSVLKELWKTLVLFLHLTQEAAVLFYFWGLCENIFKSRETPLNIVFISDELVETYSFFNKLCDRWELLTPGECFTSGRDFQVDIIDPVTLKAVIKIAIVKVFESKAKPLLLEFTFRNNEKKCIILKKGDDIRNDWYIQTIFHIFNELWRESKMDNPPYIHTYKCIPITEQFGCIECVSNSISVQDFDYNKLDSLTSQEKGILVSTLAGSCLASYILGIRDRHQDNMLIKDKHIFFHIDFGHLWNQGPLIDAPRIAIPMRFKSKLSSHWSKLERLCVEGFKVLFEKGGLIKDLCLLLFQSNNSTPESSAIIEEFISGPNSLMLQFPKDEAYQRFEKILFKSLANHHVRRKFKNLAHQLSKSNVETPKRKTLSELSKENLMNQKKETSGGLGLSLKENRKPTIPFF